MNYLTPIFMMLDTLHVVIKVF